MLSLGKISSKMWVERMSRTTVRRESSNFTVPKIKTNFVNSKEEFGELFLWIVKPNFAAGSILWR